MKVFTTGFHGLLIIEPKVNTDPRGYFFESFNSRTFQEAGIHFQFAQENQSYSKQNVIRGLHYQRAPHAQTKLVRVIRGRILDVVVDLRKEQATFKKTFAIELSAEIPRNLLIPKGFAHGFSVLSEDAEVVYFCDEYYHSEFEAGILYDDPDLGIDWKIQKGKNIVSAKDQALPVLSEISLEG